MLHRDHAAKAVGRRYVAGPGQGQLQEATALAQGTELLGDDFTGFGGGQVSQAAAFAAGQNYRPCTSHIVFHASLV
jgi:hypothetical protein